MKKISVLLLTLLLVVALASCGLIEMPANAEYAQAALNAAFSETELEATEDFKLDKTILDEAGHKYEIVWTASNENATIEDGEDKVTVKLNPDCFEDVTFALTGTITVGEENATITLNYTIPCLEEEGSALAQAALEAYFAGKNTEVAKDFDLPNKFVDADGNEYALAWTSSTPDVIQVAGTKATVNADLFNNLTATLTATATKGAATASIDVNYTVLSRTAEGSAFAQEALDAAFPERAFEATQNFTLLDKITGEDGYEYAIVWTSSNEAVLKVTGTDVEVIPAYFVTTVTLTGTVTRGNATASVELSYRVPKADCVHEYEAFRTVEPTCGVDGYAAYECKNCGRQYMETLFATGEHDFVMTETVAPTCEEDGYTLYTCSTCGKEKAEDIVAMLGHDWQLTETVDATAEAHGYNNYVCANCSEEAQETLHAFVYEYEYAAPTCTEDGLNVIICPVCAAEGYLVYDENDPNALIDVPATGHTAGEFVETVAPTCTEDGYDVYTCVNCDGAAITNVVTAPGHTEENHDAVEATCTAVGYTAGVWCTTCQTWVSGHEEQAIDASNHDYVGGICSRCDAVNPNHYFVVSIADALAAADGKKVQVTGTVCAINTAYDSYYKNISVTIVDANGDELYLYRLSANVTLGDIITVKGTMATYNSARQVAAGATATITGHDSSYDYTEMTIAEALKAADNTNVIVTGTVVKINTAYSSSYKNITVTIADENGDQLYIYRLSGGADLAVNDIITIKGAMDTYSGARQLAGGTYEDTGADHTCSTYTDATCKKLAACVVCGATTGELADHNYVDGACSVCGELEGVTLEKVATFELGDNGTASHNDGSESATYSETDGEYTLSISGGTKMYKDARDAKGNSCLKFGTSKVVGSCTITVDESVTKVIIYVAGYKATAAKIQVNGVDYTISDMSNDGAYTAIEIDTTTTKTITFTTVTGGLRCMINTVEYYGYAE